MYYRYIFNYALTWQNIKCNKSCIPTEKAIPARLITFNVLPSKCIIKNVPIIHIGIVTAITNVARTLLKNTKSTITANKPPTIILDFTNAIACKI